jgi:hypothetical protein
VTDTDFQRYLAAKRGVDDRGLDRRLLERLSAGLAEETPTEDTLRVVEVGAGVGTMVERLLEWDLLPPGRTHYTAVDVDPDSVATIRDRLTEWAAGQGLTAAEADDGLRLSGDDRTVLVDPVVAEATAYLGGADGTTRQTARNGPPCRDGAARCARTGQAGYPARGGRTRWLVLLSGHL